MIFPGFPGVLAFFQVFQVEWEPCLVQWGGGIKLNVSQKGRTLLEKSSQCQS